MEHSYLLLIKLMELFNAIKADGQWELTKEKATIDTDTHQIVMSTTPIAGNKMVNPDVSLGETPVSKTEQSLPLAVSTEHLVIRYKILKDMNY